MKKRDNKYYNRVLTLLTFFTFVSILLPGSLLAAEDRYLEEIVVTGTKRDTSMQETPLAVSTLAQDRISNTFVNDIRAIGELAPNVLLTKQPGFNAVAGGIRGTGSTSILVLQDTSVGITVDDFALGSVQSQFLELFDLERVEVYRGPQGTLFGKNSTGGVIAIITKRPNLQEFGGSVEATFGQYHGARTADAVKLTASMDIPLIEGKLGLRFAGVSDTYEGWMTNSKSLPGTFPENIPFYGLFGLPTVNPPLPPELDTTNTGSGEELDEKQVIAWKLKALWQPTDNYEALFTWEVARDDSGAPPAVNDSPSGEGFLFPAFGFPGLDDAPRSKYETGQSQQGNGINVLRGHQVDVDGYYLTQTYTTDKFSVKALLGRRDVDETLPSTYTGEAFNNLFDASRNLEREQTQAEIRVVSSLEGPLNFVAGAAFFTDDVTFRAIATQGFVSLIPSINADTGTFFDDRGFINLDLDGLNDPATTIAEQDRESYAFYFDATYELTDRLSLSAGIRFSHDEKDFLRLSEGGGVCSPNTKEKDAVLANDALPFDWETNCAADNRSNAISRAGITGAQYDPRRNPLPPEHYGVRINTSDEWDDTTWRFVVDYKLTENQMIYSSVATGFISGGFTETCSTVVTCVAYKPETNTNFEIGHKGDFFDSTLRINTAVFYTKFEDLQRNQVVPFETAAGDPAQETLTVNAGKSTHWGVEIEATWLATDNLQLRGSIGVLEAEYDDFKWDPQPNNPDTGITDFSSLDIPFVSPLQVAVDATYDFQLAGGGTVALNLAVNYQDEAEGSPFDTNAAVLEPAVIRHPTNTQIEETTLVNASVTFRPANERYFITLFGQNLTDENTRIGANSVANLWVMSFFRPPRHYGIRIGTNFQ